MLSRSYLLHRNHLLVKDFSSLFGSYEPLKKVFRTDSTLPGFGYMFLGVTL